MKIQIIGIYNPGDSAKERLHLRAVEDVELGRYAIVDTLYMNDLTIETGQKTAFWLDPIKLLANENLVLYTRSGNPSREDRKDGSVYVFRFRGPEGVRLPIVY